ncbi:MAG TPA: hypothetical protein VGO21_05190, partial [Candidatus Paceibacterota bacterium]|nr:hypothetical protein [Candidatus Paceibacterota bacterium]
IPKPAPKAAPPVARPVVTTNPVATKILGEETVAKILTSPRQYVNYMYGGIALLILLSIFLVFFVRSEIKHPRIMARGLALIAVIIFLFFVNMQVLHLKTEIGTNDVTANSIAY